MACNSYCTGTMLAYDNPACDPVTVQGGIDYVIFADCDIADTITDVTNATQWQTAIDAGQVVIVQNVVGELVAPADTLKLIASCRPEVVTQREWTLNVEDYNMGSTGTEAFWDDQLQNAGNRLFGFVDCEGDFRGWADDVTVAVSLQIPNNNKDIMFMGGTIKWLQLTHLTASTFPTTLTIP